MLNSIDLADTILDPDMGAVTFTYERISEVVDDYGRSQTTTARIDTVGNIQPAPGKERELLPEADRLKETLLIFATVPLLAGENDDTKADRVFYKNTAYRVRLAEAWSEHGIYKALAVKEDVR